MKIQQTSIALFLASSFFAASPAQAISSYTITDLGTLGGANSIAVGINSIGQVVGSSYVTGGTNDHAFRYSGGVMTDLGTLGGPYSYGYGINDYGQVVGYSRTADGYGRAYFWNNGLMSDLGTPSGNSYALDINNSGQIVGQYGAFNHAFLWNNGNITDLGTLGGASSLGSSVNNSGQVVGYSDITGNSATHAFLYTGGVMTDLGTLGGTNSYAYNMNSVGQIVGNAFTAGAISYRHAFLYSGGSMIDLGTLGGTTSSSSGINDSGLAVGFSFLVGNEVRHAFLYSGGSLSDLNSFINPASGWTLETATDINNLGQIVGYGTVNGVTHAYLLTPVPVPGAYILFLSGTGLLGFIARRRKSA